MNAVTLYEVSELMKHSEEDHYERGCIGNATISHIDMHFSNKTIEGLIQELRDFTGSNDYQKNSCGEPGRIDFAIREDGDGYPLTPHEIELWKKGQFTAYYVVYTGVVTKVTREEVTL
jgi:NAD-dependent DNA ligase